MSLRRETSVSAETIDAIAHYGYDPGCGRAGLPDAIRAAAGPGNLAGGYAGLVEAGVAAFREAVDEALEPGDSDRTHVVPLSAGLDSRAVLGGLLAHPVVAPQRIHAVTFGSPGTWDFELGRRVAATADVERSALDLTAETFDWSPEAIRAYARTRECPGGVVDGYVNAVASSVAGEDAVVWSGFMGDPSAGGHQPADPCETWAGARAHFATAEGRPGDLARPEFDPRSVLPEEPYLPRRCLSYEEQLDFAHRQQCLVAPTVLSAGDVRTPFLAGPWLSFSLNLPPHHRRRRSLIIDVFSAAFPELFSLPTDARAGYPPTAGRVLPTLRRAGLRAKARATALLGVPYTHPGTNYLDFEAALRSGPLRPLAESCVAALAERPVAEWLAPRRLWADHLAGADRHEELLVVLALELYLSESVG